MKSNPLGQEVTKLRWLAFRAALLYGLVAGVWSLFSGRLLAYFVSDPTCLSAFDTFKGLALVAVSAVLFYFILHFPRGEKAFIERCLSKVVASNRLASMVDSSDDAIYSTNLNGIIASWNSGAEKIFGYSITEAIGSSIMRLFPVGQHEEEYAILEQVNQGEKVGYVETVRQAKDGSLLDVSISVSVIKDEANRTIGISRISRDITVQKDQEREIARVSRLYAALSQINQAIVWTPDRGELFEKVCQILVEDGRFRTAWIAWHNPETDELAPVADWGDENGYIRSIKVYADDRLEGCGPSGLAFRSGQPYVCNDMLNDPVTLPWRAEIARCGFRATAVFPIRMNDKVSGTLNVYSNDLGFFRDKEIALLTEAARDISFALNNIALRQEHQKAEEIARSEKLFSDTMIESMPGILYFYTEQGQFLRWSRNFEIISGFSAEEIRKSHPLRFILDGDKQQVEQRISKVFEKGEASVEASFIAKDGTVSPYFFTGRRIVFNGVACLVGMGIDISERKRAENALREANENLELKVSTRTVSLQEALVRAEAADKIKSAFLATMSHELRTPLNSIIGFTGILLQGLTGPLTPEQMKQLGMVRNSARHLLELINDILDLSKIEAGQLEIHAEPFPLGDPIEQVAALVKPLADRKGLVLNVDLPSDLGKIVTDRRRLQQILLNLLTNGIKFTDAGKVTLTGEFIQNFRSSPNVAPQPAVRLHVTDTGIGIKLDDLSALFKPFRQIDNGVTHSQEGTGLGLAICHRLICLLGGNITVTSEWGRGSVFTIVLPLNLPPKQ